MDLITMEKIRVIYESLENGQRQQMVRQIDEYGSEFWPDYKEFLANYFVVTNDAYDYFTDACISYFRIKAR